ncbi:MAG: phosphate/phosphite/phosphonate ABC transporter substrate-binding protein [Azospirillum sp.]|nr:phosphate/phosphite/phosphonate ABC transporter substrate-binding protein [Azospirillum sp.]MCZ8124974.1 phosphate/phosphite/phosphonate ABC transporter substrate-binding protein [Magnetospirillum sp.]
MRPIRVLAAIWMIFAARDVASSERLVFGVVPQQTPARLAETWVPLLEEVGRRAGVELGFATAKDIPSFESCLARGAYDVAYMNPYHYVVFAKSPGYAAFARQEGGAMRGLVVVALESPARSLADLAGGRLALPSPAAFAASVLPRAELRAAGIPVETLYVRSHESVYRAVVAGQVEAGGGIDRTFESAEPELRAALRVLHATEGYTPHAFAAHPKITAATRVRLAAALAEAGAARPDLLPALGVAGFRPAVDAEWNDIRKLDIRSEDAPVRTEGSAPCRSD